MSSTKMKVIISKVNVSFVSNDLAVMKFYSTYESNQKALDQVTNDIDTLFRNYFKSLTEFACIDTIDGEKRDIHLCLDFLKDSERRQSAAMLVDRKDTIDAIRAHVDLRSSTITDHVDSQNFRLKEHITASNSSQLALIDANMKNRFDLSHIGHEIMSLVKIAMFDERHGNDDAIVAKIRDAMHTSIVVPNSLASEKLAKNLQEIKATWNDNNQSMKDKFTDRFNKIVIDGVSDSARIKHVSDTVQRFIEANKTTDLSQQISQVPLLVKQTIDDTLRGLDVQSKLMSASVLNLQSQVLKLDGDNFLHQSGIVSLQKGSDIVVGIVNKLSTQLSAARSTTVIGQEGELTMFNLLEEVLTQREGFVVTRSNGIAHNCDILIKKKGENNISLEVKAHGSSTAEKVRTQGVERFQSDILRLNTSGIFVSLYSQIVGKPNIQIEALANGRFAVYLAKNHNDVNIVKEMILFIYAMEAITRKQGLDGTNNTCISPENLSKIQLHIRDECLKLENLKKHAKQLTTMLNGLSNNMILSIISAGCNDFMNNANNTDEVVPSSIIPSIIDVASGSTNTPSPVLVETNAAARITGTNQVPILYKCPKCSRTLKSLSGKTRHEIECKGPKRR